MGSSAPIDRPYERGAAYRDGAAHAWFAGAGLTCRPAAPLRVVADSLLTDRIEVVRLWHTPGRFARRAGPSAGIRLLIPLDGALTVQPDDPSAREVTVDAGDVAFLRSGTPFTLVTDGPSVRLEIAVRRPLFDLVDSDDHGARIVTVDDASRRVLVSVVNAAFGSPLDPDSAAYPLVVSALEQLVGAVMATTLPEAEGDAVFTRAVALIASTASDPTLSVHELGLRLGVPKRTLQRAFAKNGTTVFAEIRRARLAAARALMGGSEVPHSLSDYVRSRRLTRDVRRDEAEDRARQSVV